MIEQGTRRTRVLVPLADGVEEMEAVILIDVLRRAGWEVCAVAMQPGPVVASRGVKLLPDVTWDQVQPDTFDMLVIPGGAEGTRRLKNDPRLLAVIRDFVRKNRWVGAVCAGPLVLQAAGVLDQRRATSHPAVADQITCTQRLPDRVVVDGRIVTSQGPGTTMEFALALIGLIDGPGPAQSIGTAMVMGAQAV